MLPEDAEPFGSYGPEQDPEVTLVSRGETYEHTDFSHVRVTSVPST
jgi:hypothetical protein